MANDSAGRWRQAHEHLSELDSEPEPEVMAFLQRLDGRIPLKGLDVGCGLGRHMVAAASIGFHVTGVDISTHAVGHCRAALKAQGLEARSSALLADAGRLPFQQNVFDFAIACCSLNHGRRSNVIAGVREAIRVLCVGGKLFGIMMSKKDPRYGKGLAYGEDCFVFTEGPESGICHYFATPETVTTAADGVGVIEELREVRYTGTDIAMYYPDLEYSSHIVFCVQKIRA